MQQAQNWESPSSPMLQAHSVLFSGFLRFICRQSRIRSWAMRFSSCRHSRITPINLDCSPWLGTWPKWTFRSNLLPTPSQHALGQLTSPTTLKVYFLTTMGRRAPCFLCQ